MRIDFRSKANRLATGASGEIDLSCMALLRFETGFNGRNLGAEHGVDYVSAEEPHDCSEVTGLGPMPPADVLGCPDIAIDHPGQLL
jgi:hypothetical protein